MKNIALTFICFLGAIGAASAEIGPVKFLVARMDYLTYAPKHIYYFEQPYQAIYPAEKDSIHHDLFVRIVPAGDFGGTTIRSRTTGDSVYSATTVWSGAGDHVFPPASYEIFDADTCANSNLYFIDFESIFFFFENDWARADTAWRTALDIVPLSRFKDEDFSVLTYAHYFSLGVTDPTTAEWIVIFYTLPDEIPAGEWKRVSQSFPDQEIHDVHVHFAYPEKVYTATQSGAYKSFNGGENWEKIPFDSESDLNVTALAATPNPWVNCLCEVLYLGTEEYTMIPEARNGRIVRSWIDGIAWEDTKFPDIAVTAIGLNPANPGTAYAAGYNPFYSQWGLYKLNGSAGWKKVLPLESDSLLVKINCIRVHPADTNRVFAGSDHGMLISEDGGETWRLDVSRFAISAIEFYDDLVLKATGGGTRSDGIYASSDFGKSWQVWCYWIYCKDFVVSYPRQDLPPYFYVADSLRGVFGTRAPGYHWQEFGAELENYQVTRIGATPALAGWVFAATGDGLFRYSDVPTALAQQLPEKSASAASWRYLGNYPNPFNSLTTIRYNVPIAEARVELTVYNVLGEEVIVLVAETKTRGEYSAQWNGLDRFGNRAPSGIYFISCEIAGAGARVLKTVMLQ